jgi:hypothetical protein
VRHFRPQQRRHAAIDTRSEYGDQLPDPTKQNSPEATEVIKTASGMDEIGGAGHCRRDLVRWARHATRTPHDGGRGGRRRPGRGNLVEPSLRTRPTSSRSRAGRQARRGWGRRDRGRLGPRGDFRRTLRRPDVKAGIGDAAVRHFGHNDGGDAVGRSEYCDQG